MANPSSSPGVHPLAVEEEESLNHSQPSTTTSPLLIPALEPSAIAASNLPPPPPPLPTTKSTVYKYSLDEKTLREESLRLLRERPPTTRDRLICYLLDGTDTLSNIGRHCERESFEEKFGLDGARMHEMYGAHEAASIFFLAVDQQDAAPAGVIRIIRHRDGGPGPGPGLLTLNDCHAMLGVTPAQFRARHGVRSLDEVWDIGSVAVRPAWRSAGRNLASNLLFRALHARAGHEGVAHYVGTVDAGIRRMLRLVGFWGGTICGTGPVRHSGSDDSLFSYGHRATIDANVRARAKAAAAASPPNPDGEEEEEEEDKVPVALRPVVELFARRCIDGEDMDHRLMFDISNNAKR